MFTLVVAISVQHVNCDGKASSLGLAFERECYGPNLIGGGMSNLILQTIRVCWFYKMSGIDMWKARELSKSWESTLSCPCMYLHGKAGAQRENHK